MTAKAKKMDSAALVRSLVNEYGKAARKHGEFAAQTRALRRALEAALKKQEAP